MEDVIMKSLVIWSTLALGAVVPVGYGLVRNVGCGACACCRCCETGSCTCKECTCECCSAEGCPGKAGVSRAASGCCSLPKQG
jgi:hypothetical protein